MILSEEARKTRREYFKRYRETNRERIRKISQKHYLKKKSKENDASEASLASLASLASEYLDFNKGYAVKKERITQNLSMCDSVREQFDKIKTNDILSITHTKNAQTKNAITYTFTVTVKQKNKTCLFCHSERGKITIQLNQLICGEIKIN